jgi:carbon-monoxide dehydrogenase large subunit
MKYGVGQPVRRKEDIRLVRGCGTYTDDISLLGQAYGVFVRSPHAHARIAGIDLSDARAAPGVIGFLTAEDLKGLPTMPVASATTSRDGSPVRVTPKTFLASGKVRFCGEAVVLVVANSAAEAKDAAERVVIDY